VGGELTLDYLQEGLSIQNPIAELRIVHDDDIEEDEDEDEKPEVDGEGEVKDEQMDVDSDTELDPNLKSSPVPTADEIKSRPKLRFPSPDFSWLPPIPDLSTQQPEPSSSSTTTRPRHAVESVTVPSAIIDRYRTRIPFASSSLASRSTYAKPIQPDTKRLPPGTSSLPDLISTYADTKGEMSVSIRPNGYRLQALDLLRRQIAAPEGYSPHDSLAVKGSVPGPRFTPIAVPPHPVAVNPAQEGILSRLLHSIQSANLPSELRERLTTLRPPLAQKRDGQPLTYGPGIRGADDAALARAQGKEPQKEDEVYSYATWDSGPRGLEKFSRPNLPRGKKVIKYVEGEEIPRQDKRKASLAPPDAQSGGLGRTLRIKLGDSVSPAPPGVDPIPSPGLGVTGTTTTTPPVITPGGTTLKLKFKRDSLDVPTLPVGGSSDISGNTTGTPRHSPRSGISPLPVPILQTDTSGSPAAANNNGPPLPQAARNSPSQSSLLLPSNAGSGLRHSPRNSTSSLPPTYSPKSSSTHNGHGGLPPTSLRHSNSPASQSLSPHTNNEKGLPHRSARLSVSPLNPNIPLPDVKPSVSDLKASHPPTTGNTIENGLPEEKDGPRENALELQPSTSSTVSPSSDKAALPKEQD
jgi:hypothetical protein